MDGKLKSCDKVIKAVTRHLDDVNRSRSRNYPFVFDPVYADKYLKFLGLIKLVEGSVAGKPWPIRDWQAFMMSQIFGWRKKSNKDHRRFTDGYIQVAKKNTKTTTGGGIACAEWMLSKEKMAQVYFVAPSRSQSNMPFKISKMFIKQLATEFKDTLDPLGIRIQRDAVVRDDNASIMMALSKQAKNMEGKHASFCLADEWHVHPNNNEIINNMQSGMGGRENPLMLKITTAGSSIGGPCHKFYELSGQILDGLIDMPEVFTLIYELDKDDDWKDPETWIKPNPNLGLSPRLEFLQKQCNRAINLGGYAEVDFKTKHCNLWVSSSKTWIGDHIISECYDPKMEMPDNELVAYAGLDLAMTTDLSAFTIKFVDGRVLSYIFAPEQKIKDKTDLVDYMAYQDQAHIIEAGVEVTDYNVLAHYIKDAFNRWNIKVLFYDQHLAAPLITELEADGILCKKIGQNYSSMSSPTLHLERLILDQGIKFNNPMLRWMFGNARKKHRYGNAKEVIIVKDSPKKKIDGVVALIMAVAAELTEKPKQNLIGFYA